MRAFFVPVMACALAIPSVARAQERRQPTGPVARAEHLALHVADPAVSAAFYREAFGMSDVATALPNTRWLDMGNGMQLHLIGGRADRHTGARMVHLALRTADLGPTIAYLDARGIAWSDFTAKPRSIQTRFDGVRQIFVADPDGYWIEIADARGVARGAP